MSFTTPAKVDVNFRVTTTLHSVELRLDYVNGSMFLNSWEGCKGMEVPRYSIEYIKSALVKYCPLDKIDILAYEIIRLLSQVEPYWDND